MNFKLITIILSVFLFARLTAQVAIEDIDINGIRARIHANGYLFSPYFEVPLVDGRNTIFSAGLWVGGLDGSGNLHVAAQQYPESGADYSFGPVANGYSSSTYSNTYNKLWKLNKNEITTHISNYLTPGYAVPLSIASWPGNGNTANGEAAQLAPYADINQNNLYDPANGDYPLIKGDQAVYFIINDDNILHAASGGTKLKIEIHGMVYAFATQDAMNNVVFVNFNVINRSPENYNSIYLGAWTDMDLGHYADDYFGCDRNLNMFFTYNGDENDETVTGYGNNPPAQGSMFLNHAASKFIGFTQGGPDYASPPESTLQFYNYLRGVWKDGTPLIYGGNGHGTGDSTDFMFPGASNPGTPPFNPTWIVDEFNSIPPSDCQGVLSIGPLTLGAGESYCLDMAYPFARASSGGRLASLEKLKETASVVQTFYDTQADNCGFYTGINDDTKFTTAIVVYPNPNNGTFEIKSEIPNPRITIFNSLGQVIYSKNVNQHEKINLTNCAEGLYYYTVEYNGMAGKAGKMVINKK